MYQTNYHDNVESKVKHDIDSRICDSLPKQNANGEAHVMRLNSQLQEQGAL